MDKIAKRIENCRRHLNFSQSELARKVGVTPQAVQKWEKAKTVPRGYTLEKLAGVLGVSPAYIQFGITDASSGGHFSVEDEKTEYLVTGCSKQEEWPFPFPENSSATSATSNVLLSIDISKFSGNRSTGRKTDSFHPHLPAPLPPVLLSFRQNASYTFDTLMP